MQPGTKNLGHHLAHSLMDPPVDPSASHGPTTPNDVFPTIAGMSINVLYAMTGVTEPMPVRSEVDPWKVITPLSADGLEAKLHEQGIFEKWSHVIDGICNGFDVGIKEKCSHTTIHTNHTSSALDLNFISSYIQSEVAAGCYS